MVLLHQISTRGHLGIFIKFRRVVQRCYSQKVGQKFGSWVDLFCFRVWVFSLSIRWGSFRCSCFFSQSKTLTDLRSVCLLADPVMNRRSIRGLLILSATDHRGKHRPLCDPEQVYKRSTQTTANNWASPLLKISWDLKWNSLTGFETWKHLSRVVCAESSTKS